MAEIARSKKRQGLHLACFRRAAIESKLNSPAQLPKMPLKCESQVRLEALEIQSQIHVMHSGQQRWRLIGIVQPREQIAVNK